MRKTLHSLLLLLAVQVTVAQSISEIKARQRALTFLSSRMKKSSVGSLYDTIHHAALYSSSLHLLKNKDKHYYIYNVGEDDGFVIVSGEERAREILAYSDCGSFSLDNTESLAWLSIYENELQALEENVAQGIQSSAVTFSSERINPLIVSKWDQGNPYNLLCPIDLAGDGCSRSLTGCVATAVSQLMYYYRYPKYATGSVTYWDWIQSMNRTMDFSSQTAFDWDQMLPSYDGQTATDIQEKATAHLMLLAGYASETSYSAKASNSYYKTAALGMINYFDYDKGMCRYERKYLTTQQWVDILISELHEGRPVFYTGTSPTSNIGHGFICDGYDGNGYFHFNWGWSGSSDGYYSLTALQPGTQGAGSTGKNYNREQVIYCKIQPSTTDSHTQDDALVVSNLFALDHVSREYFQSYIASRTEQLGLGFRLYNMGLSDVQKEVCVAVACNGMLQMVSDIVTVSVVSGETEKVTLWLHGLDDLDSNISVLTAYGRKVGEDQWHRLPTADGAINGFQMTTTPEEYRLMAIAPSLHMTVDKSFVPTVVYVGRDNPLTLSIANDGEMSVSHLVGLRLQSSDGTTTRYCSDYTYCPPGDTTTVSLNLNTNSLPVGNYFLQPFYCLSTSATVTLSDNNIVLLSDAADISLVEHPMITIERNMSGYVLDLSKQFLDIQVFQPSARIPFSGSIIAKVYRVTGISGTDREDTGVRLYSEHLDMPIPAIKTCRLYGKDIHLSVGNDYEVIFYINDGYEDAMYAEKLTVTDELSGIIPLYRSVVNNRSWWTLEGRRVEPSSMKPGIYVEVSFQDGSFTVKKIIKK